MAHQVPRIGPVRVLVTGAGRAIGRATALELAARGHSVTASARDEVVLEDLAVDATVALDVTGPSSVDAALARCGELDAVVNNAAVTCAGPLETFPVETLRAMFDTNALGALRVVQGLVSTWRTRGHGVVVNVSSVQGRVSTPLEGAYAATKFALEALSETLHYELRRFGIRTVIVQPGYTAPGMKAAEPHHGPAAYAELWRQWQGTDTVLTGSGGRPGPDQVARAVADAIEDPTTPLRVEVGDDARLVLDARRRLDDAGFEAAMREALGLTW